MNIRLGCTIVDNAGQEYLVVGYSVSLDNTKVRTYRAVKVDSGEPDVFYYCDQNGEGWTNGYIVEVKWEGRRGVGENIEPPVCREELAAVRKAVDDLAVAIGIAAMPISDKVPALLNTGCCHVIPRSPIGDILIKMNDGSVNVKELADKLRREARRND